MNGDKKAGQGRWDGEEEKEFAICSSSPRRRTRH